jgi:hypothetical protein
VPRIGNILVGIGAISGADLDRALSYQRSGGGRLGTILLEHGFITEETLGRALARRTGRSYAYWPTVRSAEPDVARRIPKRLAIRLGAVAFEDTGRSLRVAMRDPNDLSAEDELAFVTGRSIDPLALAEFRIAEALEIFYGEPRSSRLRVLAERLARRQAAAQAAAAASPVTGGPGPAAAPTAAAPGDSPFEEIEISTWKPGDPTRPTPFPVFPATPIIDELEFLPAEEPAPAATAEEARRRMFSAESRDDIAEAVLDQVASAYPLVALFIARKADVIGWDARGQGVSRAAFRSIRIPFSDPSIFLNVRLSAMPYQGLVPSLPAHAPVAEALGRGPGRWAIFPVILRKRVVAFLCVEPPDGPLSAAQFAALGNLARDMGEAFGRLILQQRGSSGTA